MTDQRSFRRAVAWVAGLNLAFFGIEFVVALRIGSVSLFADSVDFLEDTAINVLILLASGFALAARARLGHVLAILITIPGIAAAWTAVQKILDPTAPGVAALSVTAALALAVNFTCALILVRHRKRTESYARAAWLSARNDVFANIGILVAAVLTLWIANGWPDIVVGVAIVILNAGAAVEVWRAAGEERAEEAAEPRA